MTPNEKLHGHKPLYDLLREFECLCYVSTKLHSELQKQGFVQSKHNYSLFIKRDDLHITLAAVYVDDILLIGNHVPTIEALKKHLDVVFSIKNLGVMNYVLLVY